MESIKQLLALGLLGSPVDHPPEPCLGDCQPSPVAIGLIQQFEGIPRFDTVTPRGIGPSVWGTSSALASISMICSAMQRKNCFSKTSNPRPRR